MLLNLNTLINLLFKKNVKTLGSYLMLIVLCSCGNNTQEEQEKKQRYIDAQLLKKQLEQVQKPSLVMENDNIESYIKQHQLKMQTTGTGLRYAITKENPKGKTIVTMDVVKLKYKVLLLDGTLCYSSDKKGPKKVKVDFDNVETGLHQGLKLMREGEKAIFILPSHLAHGLTGDNDMIPPKASVLYDIEVLAVLQE